MESMNIQQNILLQQESQSQQIPNKLVQNQILASKVVKFTSYWILLGVVLCYIFALSQGIVRPIPEASIEATANKYPQFIFFRICEISGAWFLAVVWVISYWWINAKSQELMVQLKYSTLIWFLGVVGSIMMMISVSSVDTGTMNWNWFYDYTASFFILQTLAQIFYTYKVYDLKVKSSTPIITDLSLNKKIAFSVIQTLAVAYFSQNTKSGETNLLGYVWFFSMYGFLNSLIADFKGYKLELELMDI